LGFAKVYEQVFHSCIVGTDALHEGVDLVDSQAVGVSDKEQALHAPIERHKLLLNHLQDVFEALLGLFLVADSALDVDECLVNLG
jgi:hypothetical protein